MKSDNDDDDFNDLEQPRPPERTVEESLALIAEVYQIEEWKPGWVDDHADEVAPGGSPAGSDGNS